MKTAYLGKIQIIDADISYLHEAQKLSNITYILEITPRFLKGPLISIPKIYPHTGLFKAVDVYPEFKKFEGFIDLDKFYVLNTCGKLWILKAFWSNLILLYFLIKEKFNIIHAVWSPNIYEFPIYVLRKKMVLTVHDPFPHSGLNTAIVRLRRKFAFKFIPKLIILNHAQVHKFSDYYGINPNRIIESRLSAYTFFNTIHTDKKYTPNYPYILFFGKISPYKGVDYLLKAMAEVQHTAPDCRLIIAGGGKIPVATDEYKDLGNVEIRNRFIPDDELVSLIRGSRFIVCPYTDATQSGVVMSAFAFYKPVIATKVGGLPEMVIDKRFGSIIKPRDVEALSKAITFLWNDKTANQQLSDNIKEAYYDGEFSWKSIAKELYTDLTSKK